MSSRLGPAGGLSQFDRYHSAADGRELAVVIKIGVKSKRSETQSNTACTRRRSPIMKRRW